MFKDNVNRDNDFEKELCRYARSLEGDSTRMKALHTIWLSIKGYDCLFMREKLFRLCLASIEIAELHFKSVEAEYPYYLYVKWFAMNRLINTGSNGWAKCQKSPLFVVPKEDKKR
jgi:hypothetical protein